MTVETQVSNLKENCRRSKWKNGDLRGVNRAMSPSDGSSSMPIDRSDLKLLEEASKIARSELLKS